MSKEEKPLPLPDKNIPLSVMVIGTFEIGIALMGLIIVVVATEQFDVFSLAGITLLCIYGAMGAGLWAIQEWARYTNVVLHIVAIPYTLYTTILLGGQSFGQAMVQIVVAIGIIYFLSRPEIKHKFQTVVPKKKA